MSWHEEHPVGQPGSDHRGDADPVMRRMANPSMEDGLISDQTMDDELRIMPTRTAAVELLGRGIGRRRTAGDIFSRLRRGCAMVIRIRCCRSRLFGGDVSPERTTAIGGGAATSMTSSTVEIQEHKQGTSWVVERILEMVERADIDASSLTASGRRRR